MLTRIFLFSFIFITTTAFAQIATTKTGKISFTSRSQLENIEAVNNEVSSAINTQTGDLVFALLMRGFHFKRALMEEHFNENYVESSKFPKSTFKGKIINLSAIDFKKDGKYKASVQGDLTIHGETKAVKADGIIEVKNGKISIYSKFPVLLKDYNISIPAVVKDKVTQETDVIVDCKY